MHVAYLLLSSQSRSKIMAKPTPTFHYQKQFPLGKDKTKYRLLTDGFVETVDFGAESMLMVDPKALTYLAETAMKDISFRFRTEHLEKVAAILDDPEATENDRTIALTMLRNAEVSAHGFPFCQDTGTAIILGKKARRLDGWGRRGRAFGRRLQCIH